MARNLNIGALVVVRTNKPAYRRHGAHSTRIGLFDGC